MVQEIEEQNIQNNEVSKLFPERDIPQPKQINFIVDSKPADEESSKTYVIELDISFECRVGDLLEATDGRTGRKFLLMVSDIDYAFSHREEHAQMLDIMRQRHKEVDQATFNALCKNIAICNLLGELTEAEIKENGYRPSKYTTTAVRASSNSEKLMSVGWQEGASLGSLRVGKESRKNIRIHFPSTELAGKRVLIVGQTGKGKSTTMRQLLSGHIYLMHHQPPTRKVGYLVDDYKMEYPFETFNQKKERVPGLVDKLPEEAKEQVIILTAFPSRYADQQEKVKDILKLSLPIESLSLSEFCDLAELSPAQANLVKLVESNKKTTSRTFFNDLFSDDGFGNPDVLRWGKKYGSYFLSKTGRGKVKKGQEIEDESDLDSTRLTERLPYIISKARRILNMPFVTRNQEEGDCFPKLLEYLREGCTVILDKKWFDEDQSELLTIMLLSKIFNYNKKLASGSQNERERMVPVVVAIEEAQYLLDENRVADKDSIFYKIAFTGRSYQIGLLAITQRPQAIHKELLGQFDGFFVLPLEHANDFRHLADACPALAGYRRDIAFGGVGSGVLAYGAPKRVVSVQIDNY